MPITKQDIQKIRGELTKLARKDSSFEQVSSVPDGAEFSFIDENANKRIGVKPLADAFSRNLDLKKVKYVVNGIGNNLYEVLNSIVSGYAEFPTDDPGALFPATRVGFTVEIDERIYNTVAESLTLIFKMLMGEMPIPATATEEEIENLFID